MFISKGRSCGKSWTFERVVDMELTGYIKETVRGITKTECQDRCLSENAYTCKSASYDHMRNECHLSTEDRFTQPKSFLPKQGTDYLENQCESSKYRLSKNMYQTKFLKSGRLSFLLHISYNFETKFCNSRQKKFISPSLKFKYQSNIFHKN